MEITTPRGTLTGDSIEAIIARHGLDCLRGADLSNTDLHGGQPMRRRHEACHTDRQ